MLNSPVKDFSSKMDSCGNWIEFLNRVWMNYVLTQLSVMFGISLKDDSTCRQQKVGIKQQTLQQPLLADNPLDLLSRSPGIHNYSNGYYK